jgi:hypothetical protein
MNYSLLIMVVKEMVLMEANGQPEAALTGSPLLSLQFLDPSRVSMFHRRPITKLPEWSYI